MIKKISKLILGFIIIILFTLFFSFSNKNFTVIVNANSDIRNEKIYSEVNINENFDDSTVIVVLDKNISEVNKIHDFDFFEGVSISKIEDLTETTDVSTINEINFEQILLLYLSEPSKENVISAIEKLYLVDGIKYVGANTIEEYDMVPNDVLYTNIIEENGQWALDSIDA